MSKRLASLHGFVQNAHVVLVRTQRNTGSSPLLAYHRFKVSTHHSLQPCYLSFILMYSHLVHHVSTCARPCTVTITSNLTNFIFLKEILSYQFMSIIYLAVVINHSKIVRFPRLLCLLTNPLRFPKHVFPPPAGAAITFSLHSAWQPVGVSVWVLGAPLTCLVCSSGDGLPTGPPYWDGAPLSVYSFSPFQYPHNLSRR